MLWTKLFSFLFFFSSELPFSKSQREFLLRPRLAGAIGDTKGGPLSW